MPGSRINPQTTGGGPPLQENTTKKGRGGKIAAITIIVLVLAGGGFLLWKYVFKPKPAQPTVQAPVKNDIAVLRYGVFAGPMNQFYPTASLSNASQAVNFQIFEGLVQYQDRTKVVPMLADSWSNPNNSTWVFKLKSGIKFHDGNTMAAKDVKYSFDQFKKNSDYDEFTSTIKSVEAVDNSTVKIITDGPDPVLLNKLTFIGVLDSSAPATATPDQKGTGPYVVKTGSKPDEKNIDLVAFDGYHGGHVYTRELIYKVYDGDSSEADALADIKAGKLNLTGFFTDSSKVDTAKQAGLNVIEVPDLNVAITGLNTNKAGSPLQKLAVRQAIYTGMDVSALLKAIGRSSTGQPATQLITKDIVGYNHTITRPTFDAAKAAQMIKDAGYPNGFTLTLTTATISNDVATELQRQMAKIGVTLKLDLQPPSAALLSKISAGQTDMWYQTFSSDFLDAAEVFHYFYQSKNYSNPTIDSLLSQATTTIDAAKRLSLLEQVSKLGADQVGAVPVYTRVNDWLSDKPYVITQDQPSIDIGAYFWKVYAK